MPVLKNKIAWLVLSIFAVVYCYVESAGTGDFYIFLSAASDLSQQENIFEKKYVDGYHYYYSVLFALFLKPFAAMPFRAVKFLWLLLNLSLFGHLFYMLTRLDAVRRLDQKQKLVFLGGVFLFSLRFLLGNIGHSQITILILWCCVNGLYQVVHHRPVTGALILALGINIKLLPVVFLPYMLYRGYFRAFAFTVLFYAVSLLLPSIIIGFDYNAQLLGTWFRLINPVNATHVLDVEERSFHGLSTLLSTLLVEHVPDVYALPFKRNIADVPLAALARVLLAVRLALAAFTLYFLRGKPFKPAPTQMTLLTEISYLLLLIPLIFPHQQHYAFLFITPAFALVFYDLIFRSDALSSLTRFFQITMLSIVYLCCNLSLLLGTFNNYYDHFKILTYGALLLIPMLAALPLKNQKSPAW